MSVQSISYHGSHVGTTSSNNKSIIGGGGGGAAGEKIAGGYKLSSVIGVGTYGEVRYGLDVSTGERVAVKLIDLSRFNHDTTQLIRKEIKILKLLNHRNCIRMIEVKENVPYYGSWCDNCACSELRRSANGSCISCGHACVEHSSPETRHVLLIVQELAAGGEIFGLLAHSGPFSEDTARYYFRQLIYGLEHCHRQGVVHRDLKPENLVLDPQFNLKLVDFGLASIVADAGATSAAVLHSGVGSQPYSAPEVYYVKELYGGRGYDGAAADIWSCAVILYVMLTGRPPFTRPLSKTYGSNMRRCRHFVNLMKGAAYQGLSEGAKNLLSAMFKVTPTERLTIDGIKRDSWFNGPLPSNDVLTEMMEDKAKKVWAAQEKLEMIEVLMHLRSQKSFEHDRRGSARHHHSVYDGATTPSASNAPSSVNSSANPTPRHSFGNLSPGTSPFLGPSAIPSPSLASLQYSPSSSCPNSPSFHMPSASDLIPAPDSPDSNSTSGVPSSPFTAGISNMSMLNLGDDERAESPSYRNITSPPTSMLRSFTRNPSPISSSTSPLKLQREPFDPSVRKQAQENMRDHGTPLGDEIVASEEEHEDQEEEEEEEESDSKLTSSMWSFVLCRSSPRSALSILSSLQASLSSIKFSFSAQANSSLSGAGNCPSPCSSLSYLVSSSGVLDGESCAVSIRIARDKKTWKLHVCRQLGSEHAFALICQTMAANVGLQKI